MQKSEKILSKYKYVKEEKTALSERIARLEILVTHIINNDLAHIWIVLKIILGAVVTAVIGAGIRFFMG